MHKFLRRQIMQAKSRCITDDEFMKLLPALAECQHPVSHSCTNDGELINILKLSHALLEPHLNDYSNRSFMKLLGNGKEAVFTSSELSELTSLYEQLNPGCSVQYVSVSYGRVSVGGGQCYTANQHSRLL